MSHHEPDQENGKQKSGLAWMTTLMPFLTSSNFLYIAAGIGVFMLSLVGVIDLKQIVCIFREDACTEENQAIAIHSILSSPLKEEYGLYPIRKPPHSNELSDVQLADNHRNLAIAIANLCPPDELTSERLENCVSRVALLKELREIAGLTGTDIHPVFQSLPETVYVSTYSIEVEDDSPRNRDYINRYSAHVCSNARSERQEPGRFRYRLFRISSSLNSNRSAEIRGIPSLPCGSNPGAIRLS